MLYIAALVTRNARGDLEPDVRSVVRGDSMDVQDAVGAQPGDMTGLWIRPSEKMSTAGARTVVSMFLPNYLYMRSSWDEYVRLSEHYIGQIEGD